MQVIVEDEFDGAAGSGRSFSERARQYRDPTAVKPPFILSPFPEVLISDRSPTNLATENPLAAKGILSHSSGTLRSSAT
jgi:hypothetical protein